MPERREGSDGLSKVNPGFAAITLLNVRGVPP